MAERTLIVVESPAKSSTISKYVGGDFEILSSMGHVRDLPQAVLGIDVKKEYKPYYINLPEKKKVVDALKAAAKKVSRILLASDPDREGEAIAFHLQELLREINPNISRILFHEITRNAVLEAIEHPSPIDIAKVESQQMRRLLDRLAGYKISPVLHQKIGGPLSAGRVQSIALKLIVEREKEISAFAPMEYWTVDIDLEGSVPPPFHAKLEKEHGKTLKIADKARCDEILSRLSENPYILEQIRKKRRNRKAPPPLITSTLQQEAFRRFKYPVKRTMHIAQELYEGVALAGDETTGLITYMRTDSFRIAPQAQEEARALITGRFGSDFLPEKPNIFKKKGKSQDAHECIRPTIPFHSPEEVKHHLNPTQLKIYQLIWDRFFASQMADAVIQETQFHVKNGACLFVAKGETTEFEGFQAVLKPESQESLLPKLKEGELLKLLKLDAKQNFTKPPARYTEASLVKILEEKGIGRPSTYAKIIETLGKRDYVQQEDKKFIPTDLGILVVDYLEENFTDIMNYDFTAHLEIQLDQVSEGKLNWVEGIDIFYKKLEADLERVKDSKRVALLIGKQCPECGGDLIRKYSRKTHGWFIGCSKYPECQYTEKINAASQDPEHNQPVDKTCPQCGAPLIKRYSPKTRAHFIGCSAYPKCRYIESGSQELGECPQCQRPLTRRFSPKTRRSFIGCSGYPECKYIQKK